MLDTNDEFEDWLSRGGSGAVAVAKGDRMYIEYVW
jgi:hypothetical protein